MSFVGTIRPLVKGNSSTRGDPWPAVLLVAGFAATSTAVFAAVWALGSGMLGQLRTSWPVSVVATAVLIVLFTADAGWFGLRTPMWRRQTPKWFMFRFGDRVSALLWGLDAGIVGTTFRVTSLSWAALVLALIGAVPWWVGLVYAAGFGVPQLAANLVIPRRRPTDAGEDTEPLWLTDRLLTLRPWTRAGGIGVLGAATIWSVGGVLAGLAG